MPGKLRVTLIKSTVSHTARTRATVRALGLRRIGDSVEVADTAEMRGMTRAVRFLLRTEAPTEEATAPAKAAPAPADEAAAAAAKPARRAKKDKKEEGNA